MRKPGKSKFDIEVINLVKEVREKKGFSQEDIAGFLDLTAGYVGQVETPSSRSKYNLNHLNRLAYEMNCSPRDFIPATAFAEKIDSGRKKHKGKG